MSNVPETRRELSAEDRHILDVVEKHAGASPGAREMLRKYRREAVVAFAALLIGLGVGFQANQHRSGQIDKKIENKANSSSAAIVHSARVVVADGCNRDFSTIKQLRVIIKRSETSLKQLQKEGTLPASVVKRSLEQNKLALDELKLPDCRVALSIISDNPEVKRAVPAPKHP